MNQILALNPKGVDLMLNPIRKFSCMGDSVKAPLNKATITTIKIATTTTNITNINNNNNNNNSTREFLKIWNMKVTIIPIVFGAFGTVTKGRLKGLEDLEDLMTSGDHPNYSSVENGQNTEKSPGHLRRLAVTQIPVKDHRITLIWKTL